MTTTETLDPPTDTRPGSGPDEVGVVAVGEVPTERLEAEICTLGGQMAAMECRWLLLVGEFDRRRAYDTWECRSTAHWLTWKCAMSSRTAHEKVRVARRLEELPLITAAFARGELSYSKVRALTRIAIAETEADLVEMARHATGAQIERLAAGRRRVDRIQAEHEREDTDGEGFSVRWWHDETGAVVIHARLAPEAGSVVVKALDEAVRHERATTPEPPPHGEPAPTDTPDPGRAQLCSAEHSEPEPESEAVPDAGCEHGIECPNRDKAAIAADALVAMADSYLADPNRIRTGADRYTTLVLTDETTLTGPDPHGSCTLDDGTHIEVDTARRLACDSARQPIIRRSDGSLLDAGRQTRTVNRATRRALTIRDRGCVFPGCGRTRWVDGNPSGCCEFRRSRNIDAHHIQHWANGGTTSLDNLVLLCRHHHRAIHEGGYTIEGNPQHTPTRFHRPDGTPVDPHCEHIPTTPTDTARRLDELGAERIQPDTITGHYAGDPLYLNDAVDGLVHNERIRTAAHPAETA